MKRASFVVAVLTAVLAGVLAGVGACGRVAPTCPGGARIALEAPMAPVGFGASFVVVAKPLCEAARRGTVAWRRVGAGPLDVERAGFGARASTSTLVEALGGSAPWGVIPLSPRTRGEVVIEAVWSDGRGTEERHEVSVSAAPRARGLASTAVGARVYLGPLDSTWRLDARPAKSAAVVDATARAASLVPDVAGDYRLVDGAGRALTLRAARYDETPLDCARGGCHPSEAKAADASRMTTVLARGLAPVVGKYVAGGSPLATFGAAYPGCALACHATGEPGVADGGFAHVQAELGAGALDARPWDEVPRPLRRLGGVGCLACHGPGALPETSARWAILRTDVCATCHDAPPRYGHVAAWRGNAMSRADRDPRATRGACARCHTTWGFLGRADRRAPAEVGVVGLTCAACHAPHDPRRPAGAPSLLRATPAPALLANVSSPESSSASAVCLPCHTPDASEATPSASAAALWLGRGGLDPATGAPLDGPRPHGAVTGGCVGCHRSGPSELERGAAHAFVARRADCGSCHAGGAPADDVRARAVAAWRVAQARLGARAEAAGPRHASGQRLDLATPLGRAAWDVSLVLEDPAAAAHNAPYARLLLSAAEKTFNPPTPP